jgi:hypothetical protein
MRAAGLFPIKTVVDPVAMTSGGPTQTHASPTTAAGNSPINTVGHPGPITGPPTCGIGGRPGVSIGQICISVVRAAGLLMNQKNCLLKIRKNPVEILVYFIDRSKGLLCHVMQKLYF